MSTYTVTIPVDLKLEALSANGREHFMARARRTRALRDKARWMHYDVPPMQRARLVITVTWPDRRRHDVANLSTKALIDGAIDAHVLPDDDDRHLIGPDLRVAPETSGTPRLALLRFDWTDLTPETTR